MNDEMLPDDHPIWDLLVDAIIGMMENDSNNQQS